MTPCLPPTCNFKPATENLPGEALPTTIVLLAIFALGCGGYSSGSGSSTGAMAAGTPGIASPLVPNTATAGSAAFVLTVNGGGFVSQSVIYWNATAHTTQFMTSSQLTTTISAAEIMNPGSVPVYVSNPGGTGIYSNQTAPISNTVSYGAIGTLP